MRINEKAPLAAKQAEGLGHASQQAHPLGRFPNEVRKSIPSPRLAVSSPTFAPSELLNNDVPMEIVSELLGHSSIKITQEYYRKIVQRRISEEMRRISKKMK